MSVRSVLASVVDALKRNERLDVTNAAPLKILPTSDDLGWIQVGDGTTDMDVKIYLGSTTEFVEFNTGASTMVVNSALNTNGAVSLAGNTTLAGDTTISGNTALSAPVISGNATLTAQIAPTLGTDGAVLMKVPGPRIFSATLSSADWGAFVTWSHAANSVCTLPDPSGEPVGAWFVIFNQQDVSLEVSSNSTNKIRTIDNQIANSVIANTTNQQIGASAMFISNGGFWYHFPMGGTWTVIS